MTRVEQDRLIICDKMVFHIDYICGIEYREDVKKCYVSFKNNNYMCQPMTLKKYRELEKKVLLKSAEKGEEE